MKKPQARRIYHPALVTAAIVLLWLAFSEPQTFNTASVIVWLVGALTAGLLVRAALAVGEPLLRLVSASFTQLGRERQAEQRQQ